jgi:tagatose 6-phosphate kinase
VGNGFNLGDSFAINYQPSTINFFKMILCLGTTPAVQRSMTFNQLVIDSVNRTADVTQYASGKSINAGRVLHTLGIPVTCTGFVGGDTGEFLLTDLDDAEIEHCFVRVDHPTRLCITLIDQTAGTATELIQESNALLPQSYEQLISKFNEHLAAATGVLLSGSLPPEAPVDFYSQCVATAIGANKFVVLDATGEPLRLALKNRPTVIKPNRQELSQTVGSPVESDEQLKSAIRQLLAMGPQWAVVTNGAKDTVASDGKSFWKISTPKVKVVSPIGSGDSFAAGLTAGIFGEKPVPEACKLAAACGSANAMTARAGHVSRDEVSQLVGEVQISEF